MIKNSWGKEIFSSILEERIYSAKLLGAEKDLVLYGGGNSSCKARLSTTIEKDINVLYVKASGKSLYDIEEKDFIPLNLEKLLKAKTLECNISDDEILNLLMTSLIYFNSPCPSVETFLHAFLPFKFVDHVHAKAILTLTNQVDGELLINKVFGNKIAVVPYVKPGLKLAQMALKAFNNKKNVKGLILMKHGLVTFGDSAKESYESIISLVNLAEDYINSTIRKSSITGSQLEEVKLRELAFLVRNQYIDKGKNFVVTSYTSNAVMEFVNHPEIARFCSLNPVTPDHAVFTKIRPLFIEDVVKCDESYLSQLFDEFKSYYKSYLEKYKNIYEVDLEKDEDGLPRIVVFKNFGIMALGEDYETARKNGDIYVNSIPIILNAEKMSGYFGLSSRDIFEVEFWSLQRKKLKRDFGILNGKIAVVTGGASGIGLAIAKELASFGAHVFILDKNDSNFSHIEAEASDGFIKCIKADVSIRSDLVLSMEKIISYLGGIDILVINAGIFPSSSLVEETPLEAWNRAIDINLSGAFNTISVALPWMKKQKRGDIVIIASKNVLAPGPGAAAYSTSKAGLTQLGRVVALEAGPYGIRVNILHPHLILDTNIWSPQVIEKRAKAYNLSEDEYIKNNLLKTKLFSKDVAKAVFALVSGYFSKTTGAQIPIDGGSNRTL